jgi:hypothetical protein
MTHALVACLLSSTAAFSLSRAVHKSCLPLARHHDAIHMVDDLSRMVDQDADGSIRRLTSLLSKDELKQTCAERSLAVSGCVPRSTLPQHHDETSRALNLYGRAHFDY